MKPNQGLPFSQERLATSAAAAGGKGGRDGVFGTSLDGAVTVTGYHCAATNDAIHSLGIWARVQAGGVL